MAKVEHLNVVQESNSTLRAELEAIKTRLSDAEKAAKAASKAEEKARKEAAAAKAEAEGAAGRRELLQADAKRWEARTQQLLDKYGQVDVAEYTRVKEALDKAESTARSAVAEAEKKLAAAARHRQGSGGEGGQGTRRGHRQGR